MNASAVLSVPPQTNLRTFYHVAMRPQWAVRTLQYGLPRFRGLEKYADGKAMQHMTAFMGKNLGGTLDWDYLKAVRDEWDGPVLVKGVLDKTEAQQVAAIGLDGVVVSNHGGRQCDGLPAALDV